FVRRLRTAGLRFRNVGEERAALLLDLGGNAFERLEFGLGFRLALFQRADLALGIRRTKLPCLALLPDRGEAACAGIRLAAKTFVLGTGFGEFEAQRGDTVAEPRSLRTRFLVGLEVLESDL